MKPKFDFITAIGSPVNTGPQTRKIIRSHVMLDYRRQERKQKPNSEQTQQNFENSESYTAANTEVMVASLPKEIFAADPFDAFPVRIEPYVLDALSYC